MQTSTVRSCSLLFFSRVSGAKNSHSADDSEDIAKANDLHWRIQDGGKGARL